MNKKKQKTITLIALTLLVAYGVYRNTERKNKLKKNGHEAKCVIIKYDFSYKSTYVISYKFTVDNKEFIGTESVSFFRCDNDVAGCVGERFKVVYDKDNPDLNEIDLGKYNSFKKARPSF